MKDTRNIMEAIDLLTTETTGQKLPWFVKPLDYALTALYLSTLVFIAYKFITWL